MQTFIFMVLASDGTRTNKFLSRTAPNSLDAATDDIAQAFMVTGLDALIEFSTAMADACADSVTPKAVTISDVRLY